MEVADERPIIDSDSATSTVGFSGWDKHATCRMSETQERKNSPNSRSTNTLSTPRVFLRLAGLLQAFT